jgi:hypothetical protein
MHIQVLTTNSSERSTTNIGSGAHLVNIVAQYIQTMAEFPPRQTAASWSPEGMLEKLRQNAETLKAAAEPG